MAFAMISCFVYKINWGVRRNLDSLAFSWEQRKLGDVVQITMGQSPDGSTYSDEPSDYILVQGNADLQNGWVCPRIWTTQITKKADAGDLIMSVRAPAGAMGKTAYNAVIGRGVAAIKGNEFIYQLLVKMDADGFWKILSCGSTFESLNSENIKNAEVKIPTTAEQIKIGGYFQQLDNLITLHQREYEKLHNIKKSMLEKMFPKNGSNVPEIRFKGFTEAWEQRKLNEITDVRDGTHDSPKYVQEGHPFITSKNVSNGFINYDDVQYVTDEDYEKINKRSKVDVHDILMGMIGTIGNLALIRKKPDFAIKNIALIKYTGDIEYKYLYQALQADCVTSQLSTGMDGGTQKFVSIKKIRELDIPFPEECEQKKIGTYFSNIDTLITLHQRELEKLQNIKKSMLEKMFVSEEKRK